MIEGLRPYGTYRDSGQRWIGGLPSEWAAIPLCRISTLKTECGHPELELLSVYLNRGVIRYSESQGQVHKPSLDLSNYQVVSPGNFVLNNQQAWRGSVGVSTHFGIVSPAYVVLSLNPTLRMAYANEMLRSAPLVAQYVTASRGVGDIQRNIYYPDLRRVIAIVPPKEEQVAIELFLCHANRKISNFVAAKRKLISRLNEQRQAIVQRAVTRGLDSAAEHKPSDIPWVGDVPKHWQVLRAKYLFNEVDERSASGTEELLSVSHLTGVSPRSEKNITMFKAASYIGHKICRPGDLAVNTMWAWMGALGVSDQTGIISPAYAVYRVRSGHRMSGTYVEFLLRTRAYTSNFMCRSTGVRASRLRLYPEEFFRMPILVPPFEEQERIVAFINSETASLNTAVARVEREIGLMQEFGTRLTTDIVTGKLDVRQAALNLPEILPEADDVVDCDILDEANPDIDTEDSDE